MDVLLSDWQVTETPEIAPLIDNLVHQPSTDLPHQCTCPDCGYELPTAFALNLIVCSACGCTFCARCGALYVIQPGADMHQSISNGNRFETSADTHHPGQQAYVAAVAAEGLLATCRCGAVDKAAITHRWGPSAVACCPANDHQQQLLLLQLLQQHNQQVIPLLSQQLLQQLQQDWTAAKADVIHWQHVLQAAQALGDKQQEVKKALGTDPSHQQRQPRETEGPQQVIPTAATPSFKLNDGRTSNPAQAPMSMDVDSAGNAEVAVYAPGKLLSAAAAAAAAAAVTIRAAEASNLCNGNHHLPEDMDTDRPAGCDEYSAHIVQHSHKQQPEQLVAGVSTAAAVSAVDDAVIKHHAAAEGHDLLALAQGVSAAAPYADAFVRPDTQLFPEMQNQLPAASDAAFPAHVESARLSRVTETHARHSTSQQAIDAFMSDMGEVVDLDQMWSELEQQPSVMPADVLQLTMSEQQSPQQQEAKGSLIDTDNALLRGKHSHLQLVDSWKLLDMGTDASSGHQGDRCANVREQQGHTREAVPQLSDFGLSVTGPPVVLNEPVLLIASNIVRRVKPSEQVSLWLSPQ